MLVFLQNVLRVYLLEAENLIAKDNFMGGMIKGKSDPYVVVRAGGKSVQTRVIKENLNPRWDQAFEVLSPTIFISTLGRFVSVHVMTSHAFFLQILVTDVPGQDIEFQVFDKDIDKDDFLGR